MEVYGLVATRASMLGLQLTHTCIHHFHSCNPIKQYDPPAHTTSFSVEALKFFLIRRLSRVRMLQKLMLTSTDSGPRPPLQHNLPHSDTDPHRHQVKSIARRLNDQR